MAHPNEDISIISYVVEALVNILGTETTVEGIKSKIKNLVIYVETHSDAIVKSGLNTSEHYEPGYSTSAYRESKKATTTNDNNLNNVKQIDKIEFQNQYIPKTNENPEVDLTDTAGSYDEEVDYNSEETIDATSEGPLDVDSEATMDAEETAEILLGLNQNRTESKQGESSLRYSNGRSRHKTVSFKNIKTEEDEFSNDFSGLRSRDPTSNETYRVVKREISAYHYGHTYRHPNTDAGKKDENTVLGSYVNGQFRCLICKEVCYMSNDLDTHYWNEHGLTPEMRNKVLSTELARLRAVGRRTKTGVCKTPLRRRYPCRVCFKSFSKKSNALSHEYMHRGEFPFTCKSCGKGYRSLDALKLHRDSVHLNTEKHYCEICGKSFGYKASLRSHIRQHVNPFSFKCDICKKGFYAKQGLERHMNCVHSNERNYTCELCGQSFADPDYLSRHKKIHTETEKIPCSICQKGICPRYIKKHMKTHMEKKYKCSDCGKGFILPTYLRLHRYIHTKEEKPHKCPHCPKSFSTKSKLKTHENIHSGLKPYVCEICGKSTAAKSNYYKHKKIHEKNH